MATLLKIASGMYNNRGFEYVYGGSGGDKNNNGILDIDCSHLVYKALHAAGYSIPYMTTSALNSTAAEVYFDVIPLSEATPKKDDLILYEGHVGVFKNFTPDKKKGSFFGSQRRGPGVARFDENETFGWGLDCKILRPKKQFKIRPILVKGSSYPQHARWSTPSSRSSTLDRWSTDDNFDLAQQHLRWGRIRMIE